MQVEVKIDAACREPRVIILTDEMKEEVNEILERLTRTQPRILAGFREKSLTILDEAELLRVYAENGKVYAQSKDGTYLLRLRLYEAEQRLDGDRFVRISNAEIINLGHARRFDLSIAGTICVLLSDGTKTYVARRYVSRIKQHLGI